MKRVFFALLFFGLIACNQEQTVHTKSLQERIDNLEVKLADTYKPGFGDFMGSIQAHHSKLWFAGLNQNWALADFEIHEIMENIENIQQYQADREESKMISMIIPPLEKLNYAIEQKDSDLFKDTYKLLTNTCNSCHKAVGYEFNVVKIPESSPFSNQDFKAID